LQLAVSAPVIRTALEKPGDLDACLVSRGCYGEGSG